MIDSNAAVQTLHSQANSVHMQHTKHVHNVAAIVSYALHQGKPACRFAIV